MTNLTEQWKKGELPNGMYYIEFKDGDIAKDVYAFGSWGNINEHFLKQVLAEVPSYEEYTKLKERLQNCVIQAECIFNHCPNYETQQMVELIIKRLKRILKGC